MLFLSNLSYTGRVKKVFLVFFFFSLLFLSFPPPLAYAASCKLIDMQPENVTTETNTISFTIQTIGLGKGQSFWVMISDQFLGPDRGYFVSTNVDIDSHITKGDDYIVAPNETITVNNVNRSGLVNRPGQNPNFKEGTHYVTIWDSVERGGKVCENNMDFPVEKATTGGECKLNTRNSSFEPPAPAVGPAIPPTLSVGSLTSEDDVYIRAFDLPAGDYARLIVRRNSESGPVVYDQRVPYRAFTTTGIKLDKKLSADTYYVEVGSLEGPGGLINRRICYNTFPVVLPGQQGGGIASTGALFGPIAFLTPACKPEGSKFDPVYACNTAFGDIKTSMPELVKKIFAILLSLSGGIAVLLIITSGYQLIMSAGNPEKIQAARERLTSAIVGLIFIIFSFVILEVIGVSILRIPGFGH